MSHGARLCNGVPIGTGVAQSSNPHGQLTEKTMADRNDDERETT